MPPTVLVCLPDPDLAQTVRQALNGASMAVDGVTYGADVLRRHDLEALSLVVLGISLPDVHAFDVCRQLRQRSEVPVLMLAARPSDADCIVGLEIGADDYLRAPFDPDELVARVQAVLRRSGSPWVAPAHEAPLRAGDLELDPVAHVVRLDGIPLGLTRKEFELLQALLSSAGKVVPSRDLLMQVWGYNEHIRTRTLDVHIGRLRAKIEPDRSSPRYIVTIPSVGYKLAA